MNNKQVAHLWANKSRESAKGSHFYFDGDTIYSYGSHFPIARHYKGAVLFTSKSYSVSTAKHIRIARFACNHLPTFTVAHVTTKPSRADVKNYAKSIQDLAESVARARDPQWKLQQLQREIEQANAFCQFFKFKTRFAMPDAETIAKLAEKSKIAAQKKAKQTVKNLRRILKDEIKSS